MGEPCGFQWDRIRSNLPFIGSNPTAASRNINGLADRPTPFFVYCHSFSAASVCLVLQMVSDFVANGFRKIKQRNGPKNQGAKNLFDFTVVNR
jgi:hypothetical protein